MLSELRATSHGTGIDSSSPPLKSASRRQAGTDVATPAKGVDCRFLADARHAPSIGRMPWGIRLSREANYASLPWIRGSAIKMQSRA